MDFPMMKVIFSRVWCMPTLSMKDIRNSIREQLKITKMKTSSKIAVAAVLGLAAGAIAGILLAPAKGKDTRNLIRKKGTELSDDISDELAGAGKRFGNIREKLSGKATTMKHRTPETA
jgi:hypothetical protein